MTEKPRCGWCLGSPLDERYHDTEWGVPQTDDQRLFEMLTLEGAQAGLSWRTILNKRENYRKAFDGFDPVRIARYRPARIEKLLANAGIVRHRLKIESTVSNARVFLQIQEAHDGFAAFLWQFVDGQPIQNRWRKLRDVPASTPVSDALSKELKRLGFRFVGTTICYAFMQATGMVNDHLVTCFRHRELAGRKKPTRKSR
jgi:DNA-3-methyladenine glycosylase I